VNLTTDTDLAEKFDLDLERFHVLRKRHNWPHVRLGRFDIRFTEDQIEQIVASHSVAPKRDIGNTSGLTGRSAARAS
jgi:hypothetical protein